MLSREENDMLTQTGAGTPMGELFRRFWIPACLASEIPSADCPPVRVKLLGESLIAFRDSNGTPGLVDAYCPHRGRAAVLRAQRGVRHPVRLPRMEVRRDRQVRRPAELAGG